MPSLKIFSKFVKISRIKKLHKVQKLQVGETFLIQGMVQSKKKFKVLAADP